VRKQTISTEGLPRSAKLVPTFADSVAWWAQRIPTAVIFGFIDLSRYNLLHVAPQLSSRGWVDPVLGHHYSENQVAPGIEPGLRIFYTFL
jgi:hypothetical protein